MRHVFFSFHYADVFRVNVVRNLWVRRGGPAPAGYADRSMWEAEQTRHGPALKRKIRDALHGTSVTVVLIGAETASRSWVDFEIRESWERGSGLLGVSIHGIRCARSGTTSRRGANPFRSVKVPDAHGHERSLARVVPIYDWWDDRGEERFGDWVEAAAREAGR